MHLSISPMMFISLTQDPLTVTTSSAATVASPTVELEATVASRKATARASVDRALAMKDLSTVATVELQDLSVTSAHPNTMKRTTTLRASEAPVADGDQLAHMRHHLTRQTD